MLPLSLGKVVRNFSNILRQSQLGYSLAARIGQYAFACTYISEHRNVAIDLVRKLSISPVETFLTEPNDGAAENKNGLFGGFGSGQEELLCSTKQNPSLGAHF